MRNQAGRFHPELPETAAQIQQAPLPGAMDDRARLQQAEGLQAHRHVSPIHLLNWLWQQIKLQQLYRGRPGRNFSRL